MYDIAEVKGGKRIPAGRQLQDENNGHIYIRISDMQKETISTNQLKYVPLDIIPLIKNYTISKDDLYLTIAGTIGRVGIVPEFFDNMNLTENAVKIFNIKINKLFLLKVLLSNYLQKIFNARTNKVAQPKLAIERILSCLIPIPPLLEQQHIVSSLNILFGQIETIETSQAELEHLYDDLKKKTLDFAIRGKLVPQDPHDEPASELLKKIRAEKKAQLGKKYVDSYIYKGDDNCYYEKVGDNEPVLLENLPFEIPNSWAWARLENAVIINPRNNVPDDTEVSFIEMKSIQEGFNNSFVYKILQWKTVKSGFTHFQNNDVGFAKITPCFQNRKSCVFQELKNGFGAGTTELHILRPFNNTIIPNYLLWFVKSPYLIEYSKQKLTGTAGQQRFGTDDLKKILIPIPPYNEQLRICKSISKLFNHIDKGEN